MSVDAEQGKDKGSEGWQAPKEQDTPERPGIMAEVKKVDVVADLDGEVKRERRNLKDGNQKSTERVIFATDTIQEIDGLGKGLDQSVKITNNDGRTVDRYSREYDLVSRPDGSQLVAATKLLRESFDPLTQQNVREELVRHLTTDGHPKNENHNIDGRQRLSRNYTYDKDGKILTLEEKEYDDKSRLIRDEVVWKDGKTQLVKKRTTINEYDDEFYDGKLVSHTSSHMEDLKSRGISERVLRCRPELISVGEGETASFREGEDGPELEG